MPSVATSSAASPNGSASELTAVCSGCGVGANAAAYSGACPVQKSRAHSSA
jgi:hypothetical protein